MRCAFALFLCCSSLTAMADWGNAIDENFNSLDANNQVVTNGWTLVNCSKLNRLDNNYAIRVGQTSADGSATTPVLSVSGDATLSFDYALATNNSASLSVTILGDGQIVETSVLSPERKEYTSVTLHLRGASPTTQILFNGYAAGVAIDNVVVQGNIVVQAPAAPTFDPLEGYYAPAQTLAMSCETEGATIYYTLDGTEPTAESTLYTAAFTIGAAGETKTVKAVAIKNGTASAVTTAQYHIGDFLHGNAFSTETGGYYSLASNYEITNLDVGRSAILTFRMSGRAASSSLRLGISENYNESGTPRERKIVDYLELTPTQGVWETKTYAIPVMHEGATISVYFSEGTNASIDDVVIVTPPTITLDEMETNNEALLAPYVGKIVDVATRRTLRAGIWNTLCLPFDFNRQTLNMAFGVEQTTRVTTYTSCADGVMRFTSLGSSLSDIVAAGTPFLLRIEQACVNPTFRAVTIGTSTPSGDTCGGVKFQGIYSQTALRTDGNDMFIGTDNCLYIPAAETNTMNGLRAYISRVAAGARISMVVDDGDEMTPIETAVDAGQAEPQTVCTLQGLRTKATRPGIYVKDGRKVIVR